MKKWPVQKQTHRTAHKNTEHQGETDIQKKTLFLCVLRIVLLDLLFIIY